MRWPWSKREEPPAIPAYQAPIVEVHAPHKEAPGLIVEEVDTSAMTRTGVHKAWKRLTSP